VILPSRGEVWFADLNPTLGREQAGKRPVLVISTNDFNHGPAELVVVAPITSKKKGVPWHVAVSPLEGGLRSKSYIRCEDVRSISRARLSKRFGAISQATIAAVEDRLRILMEL
jgi:mRNA interferase MazF